VLVVVGEVGGVGESVGVGVAREARQAVACRRLPVAGVAEAPGSRAAVGRRGSDAEHSG
jgi:hypothetical protein